MSAGFNHPVLAKQANLHSPLALLIELSVVFLHSFRLCAEPYYAFSFQSIPTASSLGIPLPHSSVSEILPNPYYFSTNWKITETTWNSWTTGNMHNTLLEKKEQFQRSLCNVPIFLTGQRLVGIAWFLSGKQFSLFCLKINLFLFHKCRLFPALTCWLMTF